MRGLAISNIAWKPEEEAAALEMLSRTGVTGLELAPSARYPDWAGCNAAAARRDRDRYADAGFKVCALQAILYGKPELQVFDPSTHGDFLKHLRLVCEYGQAVGGAVLVFGSPKNRRRGQLGVVEAREQAAPFLRQVGDLCAEYDCIFGWEHNPIEYGCDFVTSLRDAIEWVAHVDHPAVRVHADAGGLMMAGGTLPKDSFKLAHPAHFHISAPNLVPVAEHAESYVPYLEALDAARYDGWVSIEMKRPEGGLREVGHSVDAIGQMLDGLDRAEV